MYYEDLGIYFHDNSYYSVENPVVRDELRRYIEFNISGLSDDEKAENDADTGNREISGSANSLDTNKKMAQPKPACLPSNILQ